MLVRDPIEGFSNPLNTKVLYRKNSISEAFGDQPDRHGEILLQEQSVIYFIGRGSTLGDQCIKVLRIRREASEFKQALIEFSNPSNPITPCLKYAVGKGFWIDLNHPTWCLHKGGARNKKWVSAKAGLYLCYLFKHFYLCYIWIFAPTLRSSSLVSSYSGRLPPCLIFSCIFIPFLDFRFYLLWGITWLCSLDQFNSLTATHRIVASELPLPYR